MEISVLFREFNEKHQYAKLFIDAEQENIRIIRIEGELDLQSSEDAQSLLEIILADIPTRSRFVFNLKNLTYISSTGVGLFANLVVTANKRRIQIVLRNLQPKVEQVFSLLGILSYFTIEHES